MTTYIIITLTNDFATPDEIISIKGNILVIGGSVLTPTLFKIIIHLIIWYDMKQCFDKNVDLIHMFSIWILRYIFTNVWYKT